MVVDISNTGYRYLIYNHAMGWANGHYTRAWFLTERILVLERVRRLGFKRFFGRFQVKLIGLSNQVRIVISKKERFYILKILFKSIEFL